MHERLPHDHVVVSVEAGSVVTEELAVSKLDDGTYHLLVPPALTIGLAKGDVFAIDAATMHPTVLRRGGNLTIWLYPAGALAEARALHQEIERVGGTFDGAVPSDRVFIFTLPVTATFPVVEAIFDRFVAEHPASEWYFGIVYADEGLTPLAWWEHEAGR